MPTHVPAIYYCDPWFRKTQNKTSSGRGCIIVMFTLLNCNLHPCAMKTQVPIMDVFTALSPSLPLFNPSHPTPLLLMMRNGNVPVSFFNHRIPFIYLNNYTCGKAPQKRAHNFANSSGVFPQHHGGQNHVPARRLLVSQQPHIVLVRQQVLLQEDLKQTVHGSCSEPCEA